MEKLTEIGAKRIITKLSKNLKYRGENQFASDGKYVLVVVSNVNESLYKLYNRNDDLIFSELRK